LCVGADFEIDHQGRIEFYHYFHLEVHTLASDLFINIAHFLTLIVTLYWP
jgi:hypothetical protein